MSKNSVDRFIKRLESVDGSITFHQGSFKPSYPDEYCGECRGGTWSVGGSLGENIKGDWGNAVLFFLMGNEKESDEAYEALQEAETRIINIKHENCKIALTKSKN